MLEKSQNTLTCLNKAAKENPKPFAVLNTNLVNSDITVSVNLCMSFSHSSCCGSKQVYLINFCAHMSVNQKVNSPTHLRRPPILNNVYLYVSCWHILQHKVNVRAVFWLIFNSIYTFISTIIFSTYFLFLNLVFILVLISIYLFIYKYFSFLFPFI